MGNQVIYGVVDGTSYPNPNDEKEVDITSSPDSGAAGFGDYDAERLVNPPTAASPAEYLQVYRGVYKITFNPAFKANTVPAVTVTLCREGPKNKADDEYCGDTAVVRFVNKSQAIILTTNRKGNRANRKFSFTAIGQT